MTEKQKHQAVTALYSLLFLDMSADLRDVDLLSVSHYTRMLFSRFLQLIRNRLVVFLADRN